MHGYAEGDRAGILETEAAGNGIVLTIDDLSASVRLVVGQKLDGHSPQGNALLASLIDESVKRAVQETMYGKSLQFESEAEVLIIVDQIVVRVANLLRDGMNRYAAVAITGYEAADVLHDPGDTRYAKVANGALTKLAIRAHHMSDFELEIKLREILRKRKDPVVKERILNLYHLQDSYHNLGNLEACIATNRELIEYIRELSQADIDEATFKMGDSLEFIEFRAHDILFSLRRDLGEDCQEEAVSYYDSTSERSRHFEVLDMALRRLRTIFDDRGATSRALHYALRLSKTQSKADKPDEVRRTERHVERYLRNLGINLSTLGRDPKDDLTKFSNLDASSLSTLAERVRDESRFTAEAALLEVLLAKDLPVADRLRAFQDLDRSYNISSNAGKILSLADRNLAFLDGLTPDYLEPGQNLQSLKFGARDMRYKTQLKFKDKLGEAAQFDPDEMRIFYEDHLVSDDANRDDRITCFAALGNIYEAASDYARAWDCAIQILDLKPSYIARVGANEAEVRNGDRLGHTKMLVARGLVAKTIWERKEREEQARAEAAGRLQEQEAKEATIRAKGELLTLLEAIQEEAQHWQRAGKLKDMRVVPNDKRTEPLEQLDRLLAACNDPEIRRITLYVRQELNSTNAFIRLDTAAKAIEEIRRLL